MTVLSVGTSLGADRNSIMQDSSTRAARRMPVLAAKLEACQAFLCELLRHLIPLVRLIRCHSGRDHSG